LFNQALERDLGDKAAKLYIEACAQMLEHPLPKDWEGAIVMDAK
jgi:hypothetical protein